MDQPQITSIPSSSGKFSIDDFISRFPDEESCLRHLFALRVDPARPCPKCASHARWNLCGTSHLCCANCGSRTAPAAGTLYGRSKLSLWTWYHCIYLFTQMQRGLSAQMGAAYLELSPDAAWRLCTRIRIHCGSLLPPMRFGGPGVHVELDETLLRNVFAQGKGPVRQDVFGITDRSRYFTVAVKDRTMGTLLPIIRDKVRRGSIINTDGFAAYHSLDEFGFEHIFVNHKQGFFKASDGANTQAIDRYWSKLKSFLGRTHFNISTAYLPAYLDEFTTRYHFRNDPRGFFECMIAAIPRIAHPL